MKRVWLTRWWYVRGRLSSSRQTNPVMYIGETHAVCGVACFETEKKRVTFNATVVFASFCFVLFFFFCLVKCRALPQPERRCHPRRILRLDADDHHVGADATGLG